MIYLKCHLFLKNSERSLWQVMCFYIGIEDLAANALIELLKINDDKRFVTYAEIEKYGNAVIQILKGKGERAVLILSRDNTNALFRNYSEFFEECANEVGVLGIRLKEDKKVIDLIQQFRGYLAIDVLLAFVDKESVKVLRACA